MPFCIGWVENFDEITLSCTVKKIEANFCFFYFWQKFEMAAIFGKKFFWKLQRVHFLDTLWVENFDEMTLSRTVKEIEANLCFCHFWGGENFLKIAEYIP